MNKILLDTNAYSVLFKTKDNEVLQAIETADKIFISVVVMGELLYGFKKGKKEIENKQVLQRFLEKPTVEIALIQDKTAHVYGEITHSVIKKGTPLPTNDVWIASQVIETGSVLLTYDTHFLEISGLRIWDRLKMN